MGTNPKGNWSRQYVSENESRRDYLRCHSTPPGSGYDRQPQDDPQTWLTLASAEESRALAEYWAENGWTRGISQVLQFRMGDRWVMHGGQLPDKNQRGRRSSDARHPNPTPSPVPRPASSTPSTPSYEPIIPYEPVIPGETTMRFRNMLRKNSKDRPKILFYHKHEPHYGFTNFSPHAVVYDEKRYPTSEHLFQSFKFIHKPGLMEHIRTCDPRPSIAFSEARRFAREVHPDWKHNNIRAMDIALFHKFTQHKDLMRELLATGDAELIENSDKDPFWGCGADGQGKNELGKALMRLRKYVREQER